MASLRRAPRPSIYARATPETKSRLKPAPGEPSSWSLLQEAFRWKRSPGIYARASAASEANEYSGPSCNLFAPSCVERTSGSTSEPGRSESNERRNSHAQKAMGDSRLRGGAARRQPGGGAGDDQDQDRGGRVAVPARQGAVRGPPGERARGGRGRSRGQGGRQVRGVGADPEPAGARGGRGEDRPGAGRGRARRQSGAVALRRQVGGGAGADQAARHREGAGGPAVPVRQRPDRQPSAAHLPDLARLGGRLAGQRPVALPDRRGPRDPDLRRLQQPAGAGD